VSSFSVAPLKIAPQAGESASQKPFHFWWRFPVLSDFRYLLPDDSNYCLTAGVTED
jgi:hypothetical protein